MNIFKILYYYFNLYFDKIFYFFNYYYEYIFDLNRIYSFKGIVNHSRIREKKFKFKYDIDMDYFNLEHAPKKGFTYFDIDSHYNRNEILSLIGSKWDGEIYCLTNLKTWGYSFNPISLFFCKTNNKLEYIIAEVYNIPWKEKTPYVLKIKNDKIINNIQKKKIHVSPYNSMNQYYHFNYSFKDNRISFSIDVKENNKLIINSSFCLYKQKYCNWFRLPRSHLTVFRIYYQAFWLWFNNHKIYNHPKSS
jgi:DUF1365 family protein